MRSVRVLAAAAAVCGGLLLPMAAQAAPLQFFTETTPPTAAFSGTGATPLVGDFDGDGNTDVFLYVPGSGKETVKWGHADRTFGTSTASTYQVSGTYKPFVGDFNGDGVTDIFWYAPGTASDWLWLMGFGGGKTVVLKKVNGNFKPLVGDFVRHDGTDEQRDDIFWYAAGSAPDALWHSLGNGSFASLPFTVNGTYVPIVGSFTPATGPTYGGSIDLSVDIFFYGPGSAPDTLWNGNNDGTFHQVPYTISGTDYRPFVGLFDGYGVDDIFWHRPSGDDSVWIAEPTHGKFKKFGAAVGSGYTPVVGHFLIPDEPIYWWSPSGSDTMWFPEGAPGNWEFSVLDNQTDMGPGYVPLTGDFDGDGHNDLYWLKPGSGADPVWWGPNSGA